MFHIRITVDSETGEMIEAEAPDGGGLLPVSVLQRYAYSAELAVTVLRIWKDSASWSLEALCDR